MTPRTLRYIINDRHGRFLTDLWAGKPSWSVVPHHAVVTGHAYLDEAVARKACRYASAAVGEQLMLSLIEFEKIDGCFHPISQVQVAS
jgi:hypothetical protein